MPTKPQLTVALHHAKKELIAHKAVNKKLRIDIINIRKVNTQLGVQHTKDRDISTKLWDVETAHKHCTELHQATQQSNIEITIQRDEALKELRELRERFTGIAKARDAQASLLEANTYTIAAINTELSYARHAMNTMANALDRILENTR